MSGALLVLCDHDRGALAEASLEALTFARDLAERLGAPCEAVVIGNGADTAAADLAAYGAEAVHVAAHDLLTDYGPEAWGATLAQLAEAVDASGP